MENNLPEKKPMGRPKVQLKSRLNKQEKSVVRLFVENGQPIRCYRNIFPDAPDMTDSKIYKWFQSKEVKLEINKIGKELGIYDTYMDLQLLDIVQKKSSSPKHKIDAIKLWSEVRKRIDSSVKFETNIDLSNVTDSALMKIFSSFDQSKLQNSGNEYQIPEDNNENFYDDDEDEEDEE